jgi:uncharacterized membrane-anchored protein
MLKKFFPLMTLVLLQLSVTAKEPVDSAELIKKIVQQKVDSINKALKWKTGTVSISNGAIELAVPPAFKYLEKDQSRFVLEDLWGNLPDQTVLGMLFPVNGGPLDDSSYAYVISFDESGYVKDNDASKINYTDLMKQMKKEDAQNNAERAKMGIAALHLIGWASTPFYDKEKKILHWAKELQTEGADENTLNYDIRILGRRGVLSVNAVAGMSQMTAIKSQIPEVLNIAKFTSGNRYQDFDKSTDKVAAYTVGGLIAGKLLLKVGFFAKFWKLILLAGAGIVALVRKVFISRKKTEEEPPPAPEAAE